VEIAAELVISVKAASVHVSHILRKLDVTESYRRGTDREPARATARREPED
jgi:DNA-binding NarL/FixJ family response regulator